MNSNYFMRKDLDNHVTKECPNRDHECTHGEDGDKCGEKGTHYYITQVHDKICQKILHCTNAGCPIIMQRQHISQHVESKCEYTVIACKHKSIGCETELKRKDMAAHELDDKLHFHMAINTVTLLKEDITQLKENGDITLKQGESMSIRFIDYQVRKKSNKHLFSPSFYTSHGYRMALKVYANGYGAGEGTHVSVYASIVKGKHDSQLSWPLLGSVTITLLNQLEDKKHHSRVLSITQERNARVGDNWGCPKFTPHSALGHDPIENTQYLKDDTLHFRVLVEVKDNKPWLQCAANM